MLELLAREPYASYRALIAKLLPVATVAPAAVAILRILPLPGALKVLLWIVAILASLVALANAANIISNRHILPYTSGAVCNKSSVAAMLGVMDNVAPFQGENEFPDDVPFDTYFGEQKRRAEEMARAAAEYAAAQQQNDYGNTIEYEEPTYAEDEFGQPIAPDAQTEPEQGEAFDEQIEGFEGASADETLIGAIVPEDQNQAVQAEEFNDEVPAAESAEEPAAVEPEPKLYRNAAGNIRFGSDAIRALGMLPESCTLDYEEGEEPTFFLSPSLPRVAAPAPAVTVDDESAAVAAAVAEPEAVSAIDPAAGLDILAPAAPAQDVADESDDDYVEQPRRVSYESDTDFSAEFPRQRPMPTLHPRSRRLAPALPTSLRVRLQRARNLSTISRRSALPHARLPSRRLSLSSRQPRRHVSARRKSSSRTRLCSPYPSTLPKLQRLSRLSSTSIAPCRLMPRSSIPR